MKIQWSSVLVGTVAAGCVSLSAGNPVRPPAGRSAAELTQDQARCEQHAKAQPKNCGDHDLACMIASGYSVNWDMDNIGWVVGVAQTRPHEPMAVFTEREACDQQADNATKSTFVPPLPPSWKVPSRARRNHPASRDSISGLARPAPWWPACMSAATRSGPGFRTSVDGRPAS